MPDRAERLVRAHGPKRFQANLPPVKPDLLLSQVYDLIVRDLNADTGSRLWDIDKEKRFLPDNPDGKYISARGTYKIAKSVGIILLYATSVSYRELGTSLVMTFQDNWGWLPNAEHIVATTMRDIDALVTRLHGRRRWKLIDGDWVCFRGFDTHDELDPPQGSDQAPAREAGEEARPPRPVPGWRAGQGPPGGEPSPGSSGPVLRKRVRQAFGTSVPIAQVASAVERLFDRPGRPDWRGRWTWSASGASVKAVWTRDIQRRAEAVPLSPTGEMLLRSGSGSPEAAKLDVLYRYTFTVDIDLQTDGTTVVATTIEETIDPDHRHDHSALRPASSLAEQARIIAELRRSLAAGPGAPAPG
jgi:hypothetical protein